MLLLLLIVGIFLGLVVWCAVTAPDASALPPSRRREEWWSTMLKQRELTWPARPPAELLETILHACRALTGVMVGANELVGFTSESGKIEALVSEFEKNGWAQVHWAGGGRQIRPRPHKNPAE
jgi:hypothetical protein